MRNDIRLTTAFTLADAASAMLNMGTAEAKPAADSWGTCPAVAVCVFPEGVDAGTTQTSPTNTYWSYGPHNLSGQYGYHWVYNNHTGGAQAYLCTSYNGRDCYFDMKPGVAYWTDLTPVNSIDLSRQ
ncbi:hypothetical protein [Streptomyces griseorubiginosus]|uniref:Peptidase inhibitor family I36 n=1 Tax=Streptomyces griseorubiginosus TaxID=67304 RepID=A0A101RPE4_9ACTN|nr:hypothetical protein [Streptomyces griseorubiginosus]KUN59283.1 hypothetical protein AQJ54_40225 [Streptomyces griseorubiginosus]